MKSLQSCPTLCDPIDGSPPGSPVPGILQALSRQRGGHSRLIPQELCPHINLSSLQKVKREAPHSHCQGTSVSLGPSECLTLARFCSVHVVLSCHVKTKKVRLCFREEGVFGTTISVECAGLHGEGFPGGTSDKEPACQCRRGKRHKFDPWVGKIPGEGNGYPLQHSCLEKPTDRGAWRAAVQGVAKSWTQVSDLAHTLSPMKADTSLCALFCHKRNPSVVLVVTVPFCTFPAGLCCLGRWAEAGFSWPSPYVWCGTSP